jgi:uncharacterized protein YukE
MRTSLGSDDSGVETAELQACLVRLQQQAAVLQAQVDQLNKENSELLRKMSGASGEDYERYRTTYESNKKKIADLQSQLDNLNDEIVQTRQAITEAQEGEKTQTDDYNRIPQLMKNMKDAYHVSWTDNGSWSGNTFVRQGTVGNVKGTVTFKATVSIARKPKYFMGIKIHRAIVQISWELTTEYNDSQVVAVLNLDPDKSDAEKASEVNAKIAEVARTYPSCDVSVEYARSEPLEQDTTDDTYHLLWSSDRLEIARDIDTRLTKIFADLVSLEKMMHYKHSIIDMLKSIAPYINDEQGKRLTLVEQCRKRWLRHAANSSHSDSYNGKYDEDDD